MSGRAIPHPAHPPESLFESCSWFYSLCREYLFRDHTPEISRALFPPDGPAPGMRILELGCGPGFYACRLSEEYPQIHTTGVDLSRRLLARAESRAARRSLQNCTFTHGDAHSLPDASNSIDAIVVSRLFLIVVKREAVLSEIFRVLRPGGRCFIAEPTSGFRTRMPLGCMWLLSKLSSSPAGKYREPRQADVMSATDFSALIHSQPWGGVELQYDGWYQYAVCEKHRDTVAERRTQTVAWEAVRFMTPATTFYTILDPAKPLIERASECALAVMAKAPRPGKVKTRLAPPLTLDQAARLNTCFLRDTAANIGAVASSGCAAGVISYTPVGDEGFFDNLLPSDFALISQRGDGFGERLLATVEDLLSCGFGSICLVDSDSPTVPSVAFEQAVAELQKEGDRVVLGPSQDGGYYLIGLKYAHAKLFADVAWSTSSVFAETVAAARAAGIEVVVLPLWYDVDDGETLSLLTAELLRDAPPPFVTLPGYRAKHTRAYLIELSEQGCDR